MQRVQAANHALRVRGHAPSDQSVRACVRTPQPHDSISIFMNNLVTSGRETDGQRCVGSMSPRSVWLARARARARGLSRVRRAALLSLADD